MFNIFLLFVFFLIFNNVIDIYVNIYYFNTIFMIISKNTKINKLFIAARLDALSRYILVIA
jgi:hypothetical protein